MTKIGFVNIVNNAMILSEMQGNTFLFRNVGLDVQVRVCK